MVKLKVKNFQSIGTAELDVKGFTVITGPNNAGKSALVRAVAGMFSNRSGSGHSWVRNGTDFLEVELHFEDARILWQRGPKVSKYVINGEVYNGVGQNLPEEVRDLGVKSIQIGKDRIWPQIANQFVGQTFLVEGSGAVLAEAIADITRVGRLNRALRLAESKRRGAASTLKVRKKDQSSLELQLKTFEGLEAVQDRVKILAEARSEALSVQTDLSGYKTLHSKHQDLTHQLGTLSDIDKVQIPDVTKARKGLSVMHSLSQLQRQFEKAQIEVSKFEGCQDLILPNCKKAVFAEDLLGVCLKFQTTRNRIKERLEDLPEIDLPDMTAALEAETKLQDLKRLQKRHIRLKDQVSNIPDFEWPDTQTATKTAKLLTDLQELQDKFLLSREKLEDLEAKTDLAQKACDQAQEEVETLLQELDECPTCGQKVVA